MSLQKTKTLPDGTVGNYWRIGIITINRHTLMCYVNLDLYIDVTHANSGAAPLNYVKQIQFAFTVPDLVTGINPTYVYTKILAYANSMISPFGAPPGSPQVVADIDLAGATVVA
jgi:hypothetical protein